MGFAQEIAERGLVPDFIVRREIRRLVTERLHDERSGTSDERSARYAAVIEQLRSAPVALHTATANAQHYEVPTAFFRIALGGHLKYSACFWDDGIVDLDAAEARMLSLYAERAELYDGARILDLGCGWGSFSLWAAERYPGAHITAVSNSRTQRESIEAQVAARKLSNVTVITADANALEFPSHSFDRVVSVEMFEHVRNYRVLLERIARWLTSDGKLFVHIFCHRELMYPFETEGDDNWMGRHFFTGGLMPASDTLAQFQRTSAHRVDVVRLGPPLPAHGRGLARAYGRASDGGPPRSATAYGDEVDRWVQRWRFFFMACEELFGYGGGNEWHVCHYRMVRNATRP